MGSLTAWVKEPIKYQITPVVLFKYANVLR